MNLQERIDGLARLGHKIGQLTEEEKSEICRKAEHGNAWFTSQSVLSALQGIAKFLDRSTLQNWSDKYAISDNGKTIGLVMAGNIPMVGFHDLLAVVISGNIAAVKTSSQDDFLITLIIRWLEDIDGRFATLIKKEERLNHVDAVIATGSDNTSRYFKFYFKDKPHIIRQNRTSVAVLNGSESTAELQLLANDVFMYFGLGCRNVSKLYVPRGYSFQNLLDIWSESDYKIVLDHYKFANNYTYNKSILLINQADHFDTGFLILQESQALVSPTSVLYYEFYNSPAHLQLLLADSAAKIQCIVGNVDWLDGLVPFGQAQYPEIDDYADGVDVLEFLCSIK